MGLLSWLYGKFRPRGAPAGTAAPAEPTARTNLLAPVGASIEDGAWYFIPRSTAVSRIKFTPHAHNTDTGVVSVVYRDGKRQYDSVPNVPRAEFYSLAFAESVGRALEIIFWPQFSQNAGSHRHGMPGGNTVKRGGRARWHAVPPSRANTAHRGR